MINVRLRTNSDKQNDDPYLAKMNRYRNLSWITIPASLILSLLIWQIVIEITEFPAFILPSPRLVVNRFMIAIQDGSLLRNTSVTLREVLLGLVAGSMLATLLGYFLAKARLLEQLLSPFLVASQAIPTVAIAPLLIIWFGPGLLSKILICSLIVFFPVLVNTVVGLKAVPDNLRDMMHSLDATPLQILRHLEIPAALPVFLGGLRIGATLSVIGAVVGEFVASDRGLGFLINVGRGQYDTSLVFVSIITLVTMALLLYGIIVMFEKRFLVWHNN